MKSQVQILLCPPHCTNWVLPRDGGNRPPQDGHGSLGFNHLGTVGRSRRSADCDVKCVNVGGRDDSADVISEPSRGARARLVAALTAAVQEGHAAGDPVMVGVAWQGLRGWRKSRACA